MTRPLELSPWQQNVSTRVSHDSRPAEAGIESQRRAGRGTSTLHLTLPCAPVNRMPDTVFGCFFTPITHVAS